jgi:hypothetical protein
MPTPKPVSFLGSAPATTDTFASDLSNPGIGNVVFNLPWSRHL